MKRGRLWFPLDVHFWTDPDVVAMGEPAAILFQKMIAYSKVHETDGLVPMASIRVLGGRRWADKMAAIVARGVAAVAVVAAPNEHHFVASVAAIEGATWCQIVAYLAWNDSSNRIEKRRDIANEKKRKQRAATTNVPQGQTDVVPQKAGGQESEQSQSTAEFESANALSSGACEGPSAVVTRDPSRPIPKHVSRFEASFAPRSAAKPDLVSLADVEREFSTLRKASGGGAYKNRNHLDDVHLDAIADDANGAGETLSERLTELRAGIEGLLADAKAREAGCPVGWLARDPSRYRAKRREALGIGRSEGEGLNELEADFLRAQQAAQRGIQAGADAQTQLDLDNAEEAARRALAASRRKAS